jgi:hypothetical protein
MYMQTANPVSCIAAISSKQLVRLFRTHKATTISDFVMAESGFDQVCSTAATI